MKRSTVVKVLSLALSGCMMLGMVACGSDGGKESYAEQEVSDNKNAAKSLEDYEKAEAFNYYSIAAGISDEEFNELGIAKAIEEYTGYDVTYTQAPADAADRQTAVTNIFMLKQDYQGVKVSKEEFYTLLASGALRPITEYVNASTNLKEQISELGWSTASKDGEIYGVPQKDAMALNETAICFREDWLLDYNKENPENEIPVPSEENGYSMTVSDFKNMLTYFKEKVPQGGYPMTVDVNNVYMENILPAFGIYQEWADVSGTLTYIVDQPGFEDYMKYMEDLYDSGLIYYQATSEDKGAVKALQERTTGAGKIAHWNAYAVETALATEEDLSLIHI